MRATTVRYARTAPGRPQQFSGLEIDADAGAVGWQNFGHRVGRFARALTESECDALTAALDGARDTDPGTAGPPGSVTEQITADGIDVTLNPQDPPAGFADLVDLLRSLLGDMADSPVAAIELEVTPAPLSARLRHVGPQGLAARLGPLTVQATSFDEDSGIVDSVSERVVPPEPDGTVGPGWVLPLVEDLAIEAPPDGGFLTVTVGTPEVDVLGDGVPRRAEFGWMSE